MGSAGGLPYRAFGAGVAAAERLTPGGWRWGFDPAAMMRKAGASPSAGAIQGMLSLLESLAATSDLTLFGGLSLRWDFIRLLRNAEQVAAALRRDPALAAAPVVAPIFILGLPRSGTSFLHALMAEDAETLVPRSWQTLYPGPRPPDFDAARDPRVRATARGLNLFAGVAPAFPAAHPIGPDSPQECSEITAHVFQSLRFDTMFRVPGYQAWLGRHGHDEAFAFHKDFLRVLQDGLAARRWVLKCPDHVFTVDAILACYPDARFVVVHRDPLQVLASVAHLTEVLRRPFLNNVDPAEIGAQVAACWVEGAAHLVAFDRRADVPAARKVHLHYEALVADPLAAVARIYQQFGMEFSAGAEAAMRRRYAAAPDGGYARVRHYKLGRFGLEPARLQPQYAEYLDYFGVLPQAAE